MIRGEMLLMFDHIPILNNLKDLNKITIIEGPDSAGKSTISKALLHAATEEGIDLRLLRCPDNYPNVPLRGIIMSDEMRDNPSGLVFLFLAGFSYMYDTQIKPYLEDPNVYFLLDRFIPSSCVYQNQDIPFINTLYSQIHPELIECFKQAHYIYLDPTDMDRHKGRMASRHAGDLNHLDPTTEAQIQYQLLKYRRLAEVQKEIGLLGSFNVEVYEV